MGRYRRVEVDRRRKLTPDQVADIKRRADGTNTAELARQHDVTRKTIWAIRTQRVHHAVRVPPPPDPDPGATGRPPKRAWLPCGDCGDRDGYTNPGGRTPVRRDGSRWGFTDPLCQRCWARHNNRRRRREQPLPRVVLPLQFPP